jgi:hypothetical protein
MGDRTLVPVSAMPLFCGDTIFTIVQISAQEVYVGAPSGHSTVGSRPAARPAMLKNSTTW